MAQQFSTDPTLKLIKPFESGELMTAIRFNEIVEVLNAIIRDMNEDGVVRSMKDAGVRQDTQ